MNRLFGMLSILWGGFLLRVRLKRPQPGLQFFAYRKQWNEQIARRFHFFYHVVGNPPPPGTLLVTNHSGFVDVNAIVCTTPAESLPNFVAKIEVGNIPIFGWHMKKYGDVLFDRKNPQARRLALEQSIERLRAGFSLVLFPEGTRSRTGQPQDKIHPALIDLAIKENFLVQPGAIYGTTNLLEQPWRIRKRNDLYIAYGQPRRDYASSQAVWDEVKRLYQQISRPALK